MQAGRVTDGGSVGEDGGSAPGLDAPESHSARLVLFAAVALSLTTCAGLLVYGSGRGFDLTDEVFYLLWTRDPHAYALTYQPFGYLLHPLFQLVGGDLQTYRLAGFAIAAGAGAFLGGSLPGARGKPALFTLYGAAAALTIFFPWIVTPSYNSAANVGALLILGGVLRALDAAPRARIAGAVATAAGLCLAAFAKPPLFAIAVLGMVLTALTARRASAPLLAGLGCGAVLVSLILPPAELVALVGRMSLSQHVMGMPNTPFALPAKAARDWLAVPPLLIAGAIAAALGFVAGWRRWSRWLGYAAVGLSLSYLASVAADAVEGEIPDFLGLALVTMTLGYAGMVPEARRGARLAIALLLAAPLAVALGTFNNQWFQLNFSLAFPFLALFALAAADPVRWRRAAAQALSVVGPAAVMLLAASFPYSLPAPIFHQQVPVEVPLAKGRILADPQTAAFIQGAHGVARDALVIDLSGAGPGVTAVLGGRAPVLPWLNPATPTWPDVVWSRLSQADRERAWFVGPTWPLFEPSAPARWFAAHKRGYCRTALPPMTFWGEARSLELWRPCLTRAPAPPPARAASRPAPAA